MVNKACKPAPCDDIFKHIKQNYMIDTTPKLCSNNGWERGERESGSDGEDGEGREGARERERDGEGG